MQPGDQLYRRQPETVSAPRRCEAKFGFRKLQDRFGEAGSRVFNHNSIGNHLDQDAVAGIGMPHCVGNQVSNRSFEQLRVAKHRHRFRFESNGGMNIVDTSSGNCGGIGLRQAAFNQQIEAE